MVGERSTRGFMVAFHVAQGILEGIIGRRPMRDVEANMASIAPPVQQSTSGSSDATPPPSSTNAPPGRRPRRGTILAAAAIAVVVVVILALLATGVIPGLNSASKGSSSSVLSYSNARPLADSAVLGISGAPWTLVRASAADGNAPVSWAAAFYSQTCGPPLVSHFLTSARPGMPAFAGSLSSGLSPWWLFFYSNGTTVLAVVVVNGTGTAWATFSSPCYPAANPASSEIPSTGIVDSPVAMAAAAESNVSFLSAHPGVNASFSLHWGAFNGTLGYWWDVTFTTCAPFPQIMTSPGPPPHNGSYDGDIVNATSGTSSSFVPVTGPVCSGWI
jgi:hypothetical protein